MGKKNISPKIIAYRYAVALYSLAQEKKVLQPVLKDLTQFAASLATTPEALHVLSSQRVDSIKKMTVMEALIKKGKPHKLTANFLKLLIQQKRFVLYPHIVEQFQAVYDDNQNIRHVETLTATKLNKSQQNLLEGHLKKVLIADDIRLKTTVDPSVLGGMLIRFGSTLVDDTIKNKLTRLSQKMKGIA